MNWIVDVLILIFIVISMIFGLIDGIYKKIIGLLAFTITFLAIYFIGKNQAVDYIRYTLLYDITKGAGFVITLSDLDLTFRIMTVEDFFVLLQNIDTSLQPLFLKLTCESLCKFVYLFAAALVSRIISGLVYLILYYALFRWIIPQSRRKPKRVCRILGMVFSLIEAFAVTYLTYLIIIPFSGLSETILSLPERFASQIPFLSSEVGKQLIQIAGAAVVPGNSIFLNILFSVSSAFGFDPYALYSFTIDGVKYNSGDAVKTIIDSVLDLVDQVLNNGSGSEATETTEIVSASIKTGIALIPTLN